MNISKAVHYTDSTDIPGKQEEFDRIYFGPEFCERLLPTSGVLINLLDKLFDSGIDITFVTPFLTNPGFKQTLHLLDILAKKIPGSEVVFNDWGLLEPIAQRGLEPVMGRMLHKQKRGPEIALFESKYPGELWNEMKRSGLNRHTLDFLAGKGVRRAESDIVYQGIDTGLPDDFMGKFSFSIHYPYAFVAVTRLCFQANIPWFEGGNPLWIRPCDRECRERTYILSEKEMPEDLILTGNAILVEKGPPDDSILVAPIDRMVFSPAPGSVKPSVIDSAKRHTTGLIRE